MDKESIVRWLILFAPIIRVLSIIINPPMDLYDRLRRPQHYRYYHIDQWAERAYQKRQYGTAEAFAFEYLELSETLPRSWNYGNAVHDGNQILGLVALAQGDTTRAKDYLLKAGNTPGSPQLDSFGPRMILARELLRAGEKNVVVEYLNCVEKFMTTDKPYLHQYEWYQQSVKQTRVRIAQWKRDVRAGRIPTDKNWQDRKR